MSRTSSKYWLTVHWPPLNKEEEESQWRYWVFIDEKYSRRGRKLDVGDQVLIYETETAPGVKTKSGKYRRYRRGRKGIIARVEIRSPREESKNEKDEVHEDGRVFRWRYHYRTGGRKDIFIPLTSIRKALNYKHGWAPQIAGGLKPLFKDQFDRILSEAE